MNLDRPTGTDLQVILKADAASVVEGGDELVPGTAGVVRPERARFTSVDVACHGHSRLAFGKIKAESQFATCSQSEVWPNLQSRCDRGAPPSEDRACREQHPALRRRLFSHVD